MGLLSTVSGWFRGRSVEARAAGGVVGRGDLEGGLLSPGAAGRGAPARGTRELIAAYREQPWLRAVTNRIARGVASMQWSVYVRASEPVKAGRLAPTWRWGVDRAVRDSALLASNREGRAKRMAQLQRAGVLREVADHPMLELLQRPNPMMTGHTALQVTQVWLDIKGEAFWLVSFGADGTPNGLWPVPPHWVRAVPSSAAPFFIVSSGSVQMSVDPKAMVWLRDIDPENPYGRGAGVAESLGDELETDEYAAKYLKAWFFNNATPSMLVSFETNATTKQLEEARDKWEASHRGVHNAHRAHFAAGKMNAVKLDTSFRDQQLLELRRMHRDTVIQVFGVPPEAVGVIENSNRATIDGAGYMYAVGVEHPRCEFLRSELSHQLLPKFKGGDAALLECSLSTPQDQTRRLEVMKAQPASFLLNEFRLEAGYEPLPDLEGQFAAAMPGQNPGSPKPSAPAEKPEPEDDEESDTEEPAQEVESARIDPPWAKHLRRL